MLSDVVAEEVGRLRRAAGLNREQLAERCAKRGLPLTGATIANIETGRRDAAGKRRREVTVDELVALADALDTVPVLLVFPVGRTALTKFTGGADVSAWDAAEWFGGHGDHPIGSVDANPREIYRLPMRLYGDYEKARRRLWQARAKVKALRRRAESQDGDAAELLQFAEESMADAEASIRYIVQHMVDQGLTPPPDANGALPDVPSEEVGS